jgi:topoisomerase IA-like protein
MEMDAVTLEQAVELIDAKLVKAGNGKGATKAPAKKTTKKKTVTKKAAKG